MAIVMTTEKINLADLDVIFLTYDEPNKEANWIAIQNMVPWARRVDGVKGSDAAHKAAAAASQSNRFILIDGDNIPDVGFFDLQLELDDLNRDCVFRWKARNAINGLMYGNGGISCWTKHFVNNMRTHENSDGSAETLVEFCFNPRYIAMHDCYSTTYPNHSAFQAWRAGFREGVKMCLDRGRKPSIEEFNRAVHKRNYDNLCIWQTIGADVEYGQNAIEGARLGTWLTMLGDWDYTKVQDFDELKKTWDYYSNDTDIIKITQQLQTRLGLPIMDLSAEQSKFFKHHYRTQFKNKGIMTYESN
jgi:hypothetical protein